MSNVLQASLFTNFLYPFLLMFFISYALLQKSKLFGENQPQINAFVALIVSLIFVSVVYPVIVVNNLILFMTVGVVVVFVGFMIWGFINNGSVSLDGKVKKFLGVLVIISLIVALFWATGSFPFLWEWLQKLFDFLFRSNGSENFWTNFLLVILVVGAVLAAWKATDAAKGEKKT